MTWCTSFWTSPLFVSAVVPVRRISPWYRFGTDTCCICNLGRYRGHECPLIRYAVVSCVQHFCPCFSLLCFALPWLAIEHFTTVPVRAYDVLWACISRVMTEDSLHGILLVVCVLWFGACW